MPNRRASGGARALRAAGPVRAKPAARPAKTMHRVVNNGPLGITGAVRAVRKAIPSGQVTRATTTYGAVDNIIHPKR